MKQKRKHRIRKAEGIIMAVFMVWLWWGNRSIEVSRYTLNDDGMDPRLEGFTIVQVSDLHNASFGKDQKGLMDLIRKEKPHIIAVTGDLVSMTHTDFNPALTFIRQARELAPVYFVTGNHEGNNSSGRRLKDALLDLNVRILEDEAVLLEHGGARIHLLGVQDPLYYQDWQTRPAASEMDEILNRYKSEEDHFNLLLSHRPELLRVYADHDHDLVLSGHAHGGQIRLPLIGALYAPDQGWFPEYTEGKYIMGDTAMIVSRGLGSSKIPIRVNNRRELVVVTLSASEEAP